MFLSRITIYPVKSLPGIELKSCPITQHGGLRGDREFSIRSEDGKILRAKEVGELHFIDAQYNLDERLITLKNKLQKYEDQFHLDEEREQISIWLSCFLQRPVRFESEDGIAYPDDPNSDGPTIISKDTLSEVQLWFPDLNADELRKRFRINLEISDAPPFWEESLIPEHRQFVIGEQVLQANSPCPRCEVPVVEPSTGMVTPGFLEEFSNQRLKWAKTHSGSLELPHPYFLSIGVLINECKNDKLLKLGDEVKVSEGIVPEIPEKKYESFKKRHHTESVDLPCIDEKLGEFVCRDIVEETHDTKSFYFDLSSASPLSYYPGQYISIEVEMNGKKVRRTYTVSSPVHSFPSLSITVKRMEGGIMSSYLHDVFKQGDSITLYRPGGAFHCLKPHERGYLLIAAGSGITPFRPMVDWLLNQTDREVYLLFSVRTERDVIFKNFFNALKKKFSNFKVHYLFTEIEGGSLLNFDILSSFCKEWKEMETFICGPEGFREYVKSFLKERGYPLQQFHEESFGQKKNLQSSEKVVAEILVKNSNQSFDCFEGESILEAMERHEVEVPSSCRIGICHTCKVKVISGKVDQHSQKSLSQKEIEEGYVLTCSSYAEGKVIVSL